MSTGSQREKTQYRRLFSPCRICGRERRRPMKTLITIVTNGLVFCPEHAREFKRRRRNGVSTAELDVAWSDILRNWLERPAKLDQEAKPKFMATSFTFREKYEFWLIFDRSYYRFSLPHRSRPRRIIRNPKKSLWWKFRRQKSSPPLHRLSDYLVVNTQTGEVRRFVDVAANEVLDDLQGIRPAPAQEDLAKFWGHRKTNGIREKTRAQFRRQIQDE